MKIQILLAFCLVAAVMCKSCKNEDDCAESECCVRNPFKSLRYGRCVPNQIQEGEICYPTHNGHCGCAAGLECISEKKTAGKGEMKFEYTLSTCQKNGEGSGEGSGEEPLIVEEE